MFLKHFKTINVKTEICEIPDKTSTAVFPLFLVKKISLHTVRANIMGKMYNTKWYHKKKHLE